jgi:hypothetical protein
MSSPTHLFDWMSSTFYSLYILLYNGISGFSTFDLAVSYLSPFSCTNFFGQNPNSLEINEWSNIRGNCKMCSNYFC